MTEEQKRPCEEMAKKNKEKYVKEMEAYKQKKDEEAANLMKEEEEHMKLQKQVALQLLKKKEKTENIIKELSEEERQLWNDKASEAMDAYKKEFEEYNKSIAASLLKQTVEE